MRATYQITVKNPFSGVHVTIDTTDLTQDDLDGYAMSMDDGDREHIHSIADTNWTPGHWLAAYVDYVGPERAGVVILG